MRTMYLTVRVDFSCPEGMDFIEAQDIVESLTIKPDYSNVVKGVELENVEVRFVDEIEC